MIATAPAVRFGTASLGTGVRLHYAAAGPADGEAVLFLHGYTDSWYSFAPVLERLPASLRAYALTLRGHGDSERPAASYTIADFAADVVAFLDAMGVRRATVVGHSMGSYVAQRVALDHPERVARLVLVGSFASPGNEGTLALQADVEALADPVSDAFARAFQLDTTYRPLPEAFMDRVVAESLKLPARVWREALAGLLAADLRADLHRIACPTLLLWGERDAFFGRAEQDRLLAEIPGARLTVYPETGHALHWEQPERFVADLAAFVLEA